MLAQQLGVNIHYFRVAELSGTITLQEATDAVSSELGDLLKPLLCDDADYLGTKMHRVDPLPITSDAESTLATGSGTAGAEAMSKQTSGIITWYTDLPGRRNRGRSYIPFPSETDNDADGTPVGGYKIRLDALKQAFLDGIDVVVGANSCRLIKQIWNVGGVLGEDVTSGKSRLKWATQRRRGDYGAKNENPFA